MIALALDDQADSAGDEATSRMAFPPVSVALSNLPVQEAPSAASPQFPADLGTASERPTSGATCRRSRDDGLSERATTLSSRNGLNSRLPCVDARSRLFNIQTGAGNSRRGSLLELDVTDSPHLDVTDSPLEISGGSEQVRSPPGNYRANLGLDPKADRLLQSAQNLLALTPDYIRYRAYLMKPAGVSHIVPEDCITSHDGRPAPHRAMSGPYRGEDEIDRTVGWLGRSELSILEWDEEETPDGYPYFRHQKWPIVTDDYLRAKDGSVSRLDKWARLVMDIIMTQQRSEASDYLWPKNWELYLTVEQREGDPADPATKGEYCYYYLINKDKQEVFWLHSFSDFREILPGIEQHDSSNLIRRHLNLQFWAHMQVFPDKTTVPDVQEEMEDMLRYLAVDRITSTGSTSPFEKGQAEQLLGLFRDWGVRKDPQKKNAAIAKVMGAYSQSAIYNRFGEHGARLDRGQRRVHTADESLSLPKLVLYMWLHLLVFGGDRSYYNTIKRVTLDRYVSTQDWKNLNKMLVETNSQSALIVAALLVTGNIGFLGINGLDGDPAIISILATLLSLESLFVGLLQVLQHYPLKETPSASGGSYCWNASRKLLGYRALGLYYALPNALLIWSAIGTVVALLVWCFQSVEVDSASRLATLIIIGGLGALGIIVLRFSHSLHGEPPAPPDHPTDGRCWPGIAVKRLTGSLLRLSKVFHDLCTKARRSEDGDGSADSGLTSPTAVEADREGTHQAEGGSPRTVLDTTTETTTEFAVQETAATHRGAASGSGGVITRILRKLFKSRLLTPLHTDASGMTQIRALPINADSPCPTRSPKTTAGSDTIDITVPSLAYVPGIRHRHESVIDIADTPIEEQGTIRALPPETARTLLTTGSEANSRSPSLPTTPRRQRSQLRRSIPLEELVSPNGSHARPGGDVRDMEEGSARPESQSALGVAEDPPAQRKEVVSRQLLQLLARFGSSNT